MTEDDVPRPPYRDVYARPILEFLDDLRHCREPHDQCLDFFEAASWPEPRWQHLLGSDRGIAG